MIGKSALDKARAEVDTARRGHARWQARKAAQMLELEDLELRAGDDVLAAGEQADEAAGNIALQAAALRSSVDVAGRTAHAAARLLEEAERRALAAEADDLDHQALEHDREADKRDQRTKELLAQLNDHEGVEYAPRLLESPGGIAGSGVTPTTRTHLVRGLATGLRRQAIILRHTADTGEVPTFVPGDVNAQAAPLLTDSLRAYRDSRATAAV